MPPVISKLTRPRPSVNRPNQEQGPSQSVLHDDEPLINPENGDSHLAYIISDVISNLKSQKSQSNNKKKRKCKDPCSVCSKNVNKNQKAIQCNQCDFWSHA